jgi:hypothetical protein
VEMEWDVRSRGGEGERWWKEDIDLAWERWVRGEEGKVGCSGCGAWRLGEGVKSTRSIMRQRMSYRRFSKEGMMVND